MWNAFAFLFLALLPSASEAAFPKVVLEIKRTSEKEFAAKVISYQELEKTAAVWTVGPSHELTLDSKTPEGGFVYSVKAPMPLLPENHVFVVGFFYNEKQNGFSYKLSGLGSLKVDESKSFFFSSTTLETPKKVPDVKLSVISADKAQKLVVESEVPLVLPSVKLGPGWHALVEATDAPEGKHVYHSVPASLPVGSPFEFSHWFDGSFQASHSLHAKSATEVATTATKVTSRYKFDADIAAAAAAAAAHELLMKQGDALFQQVNAWRVANGRQPYIWDPSLCVADDMGHSNFRRGAIPGARLTNWSGSIGGSVSMWANSTAGHRENMLSGTYAGIGYAGNSATMNIR